MWEEIGGGYTARGLLRQVKRSGRGPSGRGDAASGRTVNVVRTNHVVIRGSACCQIRRTPCASRRSAKSQIGTRKVFVLTELARELCRSCPDCLALPSRGEHGHVADWVLESCACRTGLGEISVMRAGAPGTCDWAADPPWGVGDPQPLSPSSQRAGGSSLMLRRIGLCSNKRGSLHWSCHI
jgi:hypothetical protein